MLDSSTSEQEGGSLAKWPMLSDQELLRHCAVIRDLSDSDFKWLLTISTRNRYAPGQMIDGPIHGEGGAFLVVRGGVRIYLLSPDSREFTLFYRYSGEIFELGEIESRATGERIAVAVGRNTLIYSVPWRRFLDIVAPGPARSFATHLRALLAEEQRVIQELAFYTMKARLAHKLVELSGATPDGVVRTTRAQLAAMIGTRPEVVIRGLHDLREEGAIHYRPHAREVLVLKPQWLAAF